MTILYLNSQGGQLIIGKICVVPAALAFSVGCCVTQKTFVTTSRDSMAPSKAVTRDAKEILQQFGGCFVDEENPVQHYFAWGHVWGSMAEEYPEMFRDWYE